jgi:hypothetical protein
MQGIQVVKAVFGAAMAVTQAPADGYTMQEILATPGAREFIARIGSDPLPLGPADMRRFQISETERFRRIADGAGIKPE